jgi:DNA-directed RNA polymerase specialized sigma24 family protein
LEDISELIRRVNFSEPGAQDALIASAYSELRKLARSRLRGGGRNTVLDTTALVHEALEGLAQAEPRLAKVVEMRYFGGYSEQEIAEALELTDRTVRRDWDKARLLLGAMLRR